MLVGWKVRPSAAPLPPQSVRMLLPEVIHDPISMRQRVVQLQSQGQRIGLVPTMGALHAGHLSLAQAAREECDTVVATIFVNPTQFGQGEDFERYPRNLRQDLELLATVGCDLAFAPSVEVMYPAGCETRIDVGSLARVLEGEFRPGHFDGVATVVMKLFQLAPADIAYFGQKDYQQTLVIARMVADLNAPIELRTCPTIREPDGLAMSSRNAYLSPDERRRALALSEGLNTARRMFEQGERNAERLRSALLARLQQAELRTDYVAIVRKGSVEPLHELNQPAVIAIAARAGKTRLIDNAVLE